MSEKTTEENLERMLEESSNGKMIEGEIDLITKVLCSDIQTK